MSGFGSLISLINYFYILSLSSISSHHIKVVWLKIL
jgi:hypothetical protein